MEDPKRDTVSRPRNNSCQALGPAAALAPRRWPMNARGDGRFFVGVLLTALVGFALWVAIGLIVVWLSSGTAGAGPHRIVQIATAQPGLAVEYEIPPDKRLHYSDVNAWALDDMGQIFPVVAEADGTVRIVEYPARFWGK